MLYNKKMFTYEDVSNDIKSILLKILMRPEFSWNRYKSVKKQIKKITKWLNQNNGNSNTEYNLESIGQMKSDNCYNINWRENLRKKTDTRLLMNIFDCTRYNRFKDSFFTQYTLELFRELVDVFKKYNVVIYYTTVHNLTISGYSTMGDKFAVLLTKGKYDIELQREEPSDCECYNENSINACSCFK